jgi:hypothetical protein
MPQRSTTDAIDLKLHGIMKFSCSFPMQPESLANSSGGIQHIVTSTLLMTTVFHYTINAERGHSITRVLALGEGFGKGLESKIINRLYNAC